MQASGNTHGFTARVGADGLSDPDFCAIQCTDAFVLQTEPGYRIDTGAFAGSQLLCRDIVERADGVIADGGGMHVYDNAVLTLVSPVIERNFANLGGGLFVGNTDAPVTTSRALVTRAALKLTRRLRVAAPMRAASKRVNRPRP